MSTPSEHLDQVTRRVGTVTRDGDELRMVTVRRTLPASVDEVWSAATEPDRVGRWFLPLSGDLEPGGAYRLEGNASGQVLACDRPERLSLSWVHGDRVSWVDVSLRPVDDGALLQLDHSLPQDDHLAEFGPGAVGIGWELALVGLAAHLADPDSTPSSDPELLASLDGLHAGAGAAWAEAAIADGDDPERARAAARRCVAAYTG